MWVRQDYDPEQEFQGLEIVLAEGLLKNSIKEEEVLDYPWDLDRHNPTKEWVFFCNGEGIDWGYPLSSQVPSDYNPD